MRTAVFLLVVLVMSAAAGAQRADVKRLDGTRIAKAEIDGIVTRLMRAAEVTGVGLALFSDGQPALVQHHVVAVDPARFEPCLGRYRFSADVVLIVRRQGDHLAIQESDEPAQEIFPESERDFFSTVADDVLTFEAGGSGRADSVDPPYRRPRVYWDAD